MCLVIPKAQQKTQMPFDSHGPSGGAIHIPEEVVTGSILACNSELLGYKHAGFKHILVVYMTLCWDMLGLYKTSGCNHSKLYGII